MSDSSQNKKIIDGVIVLSEFDVGELPNPPSDKIYLFAEDDSGITVVKTRDSDGNEIELGAGGGGGGGGGGHHVSWENITGDIEDNIDLSSALSGKSNLSHSHNASEITGGVLSASRLPTPTPTEIGGVKRNVGSVGQAVTGINSSGDLLFGSVSSSTSSSITNPGVAYVSTSGSNLSGVVGNPLRPFLTVQAAYNSGARHFILGTGSFSLGFTGSIFSSISVEGNAASNFYMTGSGYAGSPGSDGDEFENPTVGGNGGDGPTIFLISDNKVNIHGTFVGGEGGKGGNAWSDAVDPSDGAVGGDGGSPGTLNFFNCRFGDLNIAGGNGGLGGDGSAGGPQGDQGVSSADPLSWGHDRVMFMNCHLQNTLVESMFQCTAIKTSSELDQAFFGYELKN